jgi:hypothetical protein
MKTFQIVVNGKTYTGHYNQNGQVAQMFGNGQHMKLDGKLGKLIIAALQAAALQA